MANRTGAVIVVSVLAAAFAIGARSATVPTINATMTQVFAVNAQTIWDVSSHAFNAKGDGLVAAKVSTKDWKALAEAGRQMQERALLLAKEPRSLTVTSKDEQVMGQDASHAGAKNTWDAASPQQIRALIQANPALFTQKANALASAGEDLVKAARTKDVKVLYRVSSNLDENCDGCHQPFWGTDEPPPVPAAVAKSKPLGR